MPTDINKLLIYPIYFPNLKENTLTCIFTWKLRKMTNNIKFVSFKITILWLITIIKLLLIIVNNI